MKNNSKFAHLVTGFVFVMAMGQGAPSFAKDFGPANENCDQYTKDSKDWLKCVGQVGDRPATDDELFYAGYWLAKTGRYDEALTFLRQAQKPDDRILTYIGFSLRKLGFTNEAFRYYQTALEQKPDAVVTRAYLGEAYLSVGDLNKAKLELEKIVRLCGEGCLAYRELAGHIQDYEKAKS